MSEENKETASAEEQAAESQEAAQPASNEVQLSGLFAFKAGMSTVFTENGDAVPVTVLRYEPWVVSQVKTDEKDGYQAVQIACRPKKKKNGKKAEVGHAKAAGFENGAQFVREIRQASGDIQVGQKVALGSLAKGDTVHLSARSKGRGFAGAMKRWNFGGGRASHGSGFHRKPGSIGNCEFPGRVMPGKKMPGHYGDKNITVRNLEIVEVLAEESVLLVKGSVPGATNSLVRLMKG